jgi:hypothetical protein
LKSPAQRPSLTTAKKKKLERQQRYFCNKQHVIDFFKDKTVAIVGSGPGSLKNKQGYIDSHDVVVRVNNYKLFLQTGFRTDVFYSFFGTSIRKNVQILKRDGVRLCMAKCPNSKPIRSAWHEQNGKLLGVDYRYIYDVRSQWWFCPTYVPTDEEFLAHFNLLDRHVPTTGFSAILDVLSCYPKSLYITGFDFFSSGIHNVNESWKAGNPADPIGHKPELEIEWLRHNMENYPIYVDATLAAVMEKTYAKRETKSLLYPPVTIGNKRVA